VAINPLTLKSDVGEVRAAQVPVVLLPALGGHLLGLGRVHGHGGVVPGGLMVSDQDRQVRHVRLKQK